MSARYVCCPRAVFAQYWVLPWAAVRAAAEQGRDGLTFEALAHRKPDNVAFLREGDGRMTGQTLLYQQNW
jgi:hypothetical protein